MKPLGKRSARAWDRLQARRANAVAKANGARTSSAPSAKMELNAYSATARGTSVNAARIPPRKPSWTPTSNSRTLTANRADNCPAGKGLPPDKSWLATRARASLATFCANRDWSVAPTVAPAPLMSVAATPTIARVAELETHLNVGEMRCGSTESEPPKKPAAKAVVAWPTACSIAAQRRIRKGNDRLTPSGPVRRRRVRSERTALERPSRALTRSRWKKGVAKGVHRRKAGRAEPSGSVSSSQVPPPRVDFVDRILHTCALPKVGAHRKSRYSEFGPSGHTKVKWPPMTLTLRGPKFAHVLEGRPFGAGGNHSPREYRASHIGCISNSLPHHPQQIEPVESSRSSQWVAGGPHLTVQEAAMIDMKNRATAAKLPPIDDEYGREYGRSIGGLQHDIVTPRGRSGRF